MNPGLDIDLGIVHSADYHGPDRRASERRSGLERRLTTRAGYGWWDDPDRRENRQRRAMPHHPQ